MYDKSLISEQLLANLKIKRDSMRNEAFVASQSILGEEGIEALKYLYDLYDEKIYLWLAALWEPEIGGFYFSNSGRDTEGFLPDIESTVQAIQFIGASGLRTFNYENNEEKIKQPILRFAKGLQDPDGYFYHPQWGKDISISRRGRDLTWACLIIKDYGGTFNYPTPLDKKEGEEKSDLLPEHLKATEKFCEYLEGLDIKNKSYSVGNLLQAQISQIIAAGDEFVDILTKWYEANQNTENGTWSDKINYHATNGLMKICLAYTAVGKEIPNARLAMNSIVKVILSETPDSQITSFYNPWITLKMILDNLNKFGNVELANQLRDDLVADAPMMIKRTADKVRNFRRDDGSYSYSPAGVCKASQGAPVAYPLMPEGDINGNYLATVGVVRNVCITLGIPAVPLFCKEDGELFFKLIECSYASNKIYPKPVAN